MVSLKTTYVNLNISQNIHGEIKGNKAEISHIIIIIMMVTEHMFFLLHIYILIFHQKF